MTFKRNNFGALQFVLALVACPRDDARRSCTKRNG